MCACVRECLIFLRGRYTFCSVAEQVRSGGHSSRISISREAYLV
jgi:hypothetical protein